MYKIAIVGCGNIFKRHAEVLSGNKDFKIIAVCDNIPTRAIQAAYKTGSQSFDDYRILLEEKADDLDMVVICTWPSVHAEIACTAMKAGLHVLIEKPMTLTITDAEKIIEVSRKKRRRVFEVKQNRYNKAIEALKATVCSGALGKLSLVTARLRWFRDNNYFKKDFWRGTWEHDGGVFASQACHHIDLLRYIGGPVKSVSAFTKPPILDIEAEDTGVAIVQFSGGHIGTIEATNAARPQNLEASISVLGENGTIIVGGTSANKIEYWNVGDWPLPEGSNENPPDIYGYGHKRVYEEIALALDDQPANIVDAEDALENIRLVNAIYDSAYERNPLGL